MYQQCVTRLANVPCPKDVEPLRDALLAMFGHQEGLFEHRGKLYLHAELSEDASTDTDLVPDLTLDEPQPPRNMGAVVHIRHNGVDADAGWALLISRGNCNFGGDVTFAGPATFNYDITFGSGACVASDLCVDGGLNVDGNSTFGGDVTIDGTTTLSGSLVFGGTVCFTRSNLITNGGGETGDATGWTTVAGAPGARTADLWGTPHAGTYSLWFGANATGEMYQDIDVSGYAISIDQGTQNGTFAGYILSYDQAVDDQGRFVVEYRNSGGTVLSSYDTGLVAPLTWTAYTDTRAFPVGTRTVRIRLLGTRNTGTNLDAYFDSLSFTLTC